MIQPTAQPCGPGAGGASAMLPDQPGPAGSAARGPLMRRLAPLAALLAGAFAAWLIWGDALGFETLSANREALLAWRDQNYALSALVFTGVYALVAAFALPGAAWLTIGGGFLFGVAPGAAFSVVGASIGAAAVFLAAKHGLGDMLRARTGGWLRRFEEGVRDNEISFMLVIRLVPAVPFFIANLAPAFLGVRTRTFLWTTVLGIIPGAAVYASVGAGLGEVFERGEVPDLGVIFEPHVLLPLLGLAALASLPALLRLLGARKSD